MGGVHEINIPNNFSDPVQPVKVFSLCLKTHLSFLNYLEHTLNTS